MSLQLWPHFYLVGDFTDSCRKWWCNVIMSRYFQCSYNGILQEEKNVEKPSKTFVLLIVVSHAFTLHCLLSKVANLEKKSGRNILLEMVVFPPTAAPMDCSPTTNHVSCSLKGYNSYSSSTGTEPTLCSYYVCLYHWCSPPTHKKSRIQHAQARTLLKVILGNVGNHYLK